MPPLTNLNEPSSPLIRRIERISHGIFGTYADNAEVPDFATVNVVYGPNASGKSTLAHALDAARAETNGFARLSLEIEDVAGRRSTGGQDDPIFGNLLVFGDDYVDRNHRFEAGVDMEAVLTLGERAADADRRLDELRPQVAAATVDLQTAIGASQTSASQLDTTYRSVSSLVYGSVSAAGGRYSSRHKYTKSTVQQAFDGDRSSWSLLSDDELAAKQALVNSVEPQPVPEVSPPVAVAPDLVRRISNCLREVPTVTALDTLQRHPEATTWVDEGRQLHGADDPCLFCGSALTDERRLQIERHFSDAVTRLQQEIRDN